MIYKFILDFKMTHLKRTNSQEKKILVADSLQLMLQEIKTKFIPTENHDEYEKYCLDIISRNQDVFNSTFITQEIKNAKVDRKRKSDENIFERQKVIETYLKSSLVQKKNMIMNDLTFYDSLPENNEDMIIYLKQALDLENVLTNNNISNKIYVGQLLIKLKKSFDDVSVFLVYLRTQQIIISKTELYFSINLANLAEEYNKLTLLAIPLRYLKSNYKVICQIFKNDKTFWSTII